MYFFTYAASAGAPILYLEDLFVQEAHRKKGIGSQMLAMLASMATQQNCCRMEWHAFTWNEGALAFYQSMGAKLKEELAQVRLEEVAMQHLADAARF